MARIMIPLGCRIAQYWQVQRHSYWLLLTASFLGTGHQQILERQIKRHTRQLKLFSTNNIQHDIKLHIYKDQHFQTFLYGEPLHMKMFTGKKKLAMWSTTGQNKTKRQLVAYSNYSSIANHWTKIPVTFWWIFEFLVVFAYSTISCGIPNNVLWNPRVPQNPEWEILT